MLEKASDITESQINTTSYEVTWTRAAGNLDGYVVNCLCGEGNSFCNNHTSGITGDTYPSSYMCTGLTEGSAYRTYITTVRAGWADAMASSTTITKTCKFHCLLEFNDALFIVWLHIYFWVLKYCMISFTGHLLYNSCGC